MIAAPFLGEFGWLVAMWVPFLRHRALKDGGMLVVYCEPGQEALFKDFAHVRTVDVDVRRRDCQNAWVQGIGPMKRPSYVQLVRRDDPKAIARQILTPDDMQRFIEWPPKRPPRLVVDPKAHRAYLEGYLHRPNRFALHARDCPDKQPERNWKHDNADDVAMRMAELGFEIIAVGHPEASYCPKGVQDMRTTSVELSMKALASCRAVLGPSSGTLHLANYCLTPALWWSANAP